MEIESITFSKHICKEHADNKFYEAWGIVNDNNTITKIKRLNFFLMKFSIKIIYVIKGGRYAK